MSAVPPRSTAHQAGPCGVPSSFIAGTPGCVGSLRSPRRPSSVWVHDPSPQLVHFLPSIARPGSPPQPTVDWLVLPHRRMPFLPVKCGVVRLQVPSATQPSEWQAPCGSPWTRLFILGVQIPGAGWPAYCGVPVALKLQPGGQVNPVAGYTAARGGALQYP